MATKKASPAEPCVNCGSPATWKTTSTGSPTDYFCETCADTAYPTHAELEAL